MAINKPEVLPPWADSGDKVQPSNAEIEAGWPLSSVPPSRQRFNWLLNFLSNGIRYFSRRGLPDYDAAETYMTGDRVIGDDGKTYRSLIDNNTAQTPSASPTKWEEWAPTLARFADLIQKQTYVAFTTAGAAPNFTLTPSPAITAYAAGQRFRVKFHAAGTGADVLSVNGLGNKSIKQYDRTGTKVSAVIAANQLADVEYDGVDMVMLSPLPSNERTVAAGGTVDAITATYSPPVAALGNGLTLYVRAAGANTSATPTFSPNGLAAKTIVKGAGAALVAGDIAGAGHWIELQYDATLDKWVLLNPARGVNPGVASGQSGYTSLTGSRSIGTIYTNTTGRPLHVAITIQTQAVALAGCRLLIGGEEVAQFYTPTADNIYGYLQGIVPPGATYQVTQASGTNSLTIWQEL